MRSSRQAQVFYGNELAGYLQEREDGYVFEYDKEFLKKIFLFQYLCPQEKNLINRKSYFRSLKVFYPKGGTWILSVLPRKLIVKIRLVFCSQRRVWIPSVR